MVRIKHYIDVKLHKFINFTEVTLKKKSFPSGSVVKNLPAMQETQVQSLGQEDPLGKGMAAHSSIHAWEIPWTKVPGRIQSMRSQRVGHNLRMKQLKKISSILVSAN